MTYFVLAIASSLLSVGLLLGLLLRPNGLIDRLLEHRGKQYQTISEEFKAVQANVFEIKGHVQIMAEHVDELKASTGRRLTAIETKTGKATRKEEKERERIEALEMIKQAGEQQNLTV